ncbi:MAG TPA: glycosyltransferase [Candidatus Acidoferrales bacterium]|nr:glycosyltransferase [Candidatus Acidoferrales bacterium]
MPPDWPVCPIDRAGVLHVRTITHTGGGPDKTILLAARYLHDTPYWPAAAYLHPPGDPGFAVVRRRADLLDCPVIGIRDRGPLDLAVLPPLLALCRHLRIRIWHGHGLKPNLIGLLLRRFHPMKLVATTHGWTVRGARLALYYAIDRRCLRFYDHVISVSDDLHEWVRQLGVPAERCSLVHNGIDEQAFRRQFPPPRSPLRGARQVPEDRLVIGAVGRLSAEKGFDVLIRALPAVLAHGTDVELWIAGEGEARAALQALIERLGLSARVTLLGFVEDTVALFHAFDVFVLSSRREALPNVLLEAMAMSVPVVATRVAGVPAVIRDGDNGLLCAPGDSDGLAACVRRMAGDPTLRNRLAHAARQSIEQRFTLAGRMRLEREIYDGLLARAALDESRALRYKTGL